jgi:hypothetical protein
MPQDRESGAAANEYGHKMAAIVAADIAAISVKANANEFEHKGRRITIRSARKSTDSVGVLSDMLDRVEAVIAAFQRNDGDYNLWELPTPAYRAASRQATNNDHVLLVKRDVFRTCGSFIKRLSSPPGLI